MLNRFQEVFTNTGGWHILSFFTHNVFNKKVKADCLKALCFHSLDSPQQSTLLDFAEYKFRCRCHCYIHNF